MADFPGRFAQHFTDNGLMAGGAGNVRLMMARHEADREDLMAEARALRRRGKFRVAGVEDFVVAGFKQDGALSLYFGPDPVYHFDAQGRLRRAFVRDRLYRTQGTTLAQLTRVRTAGATELRRYDLNKAELDDFLQTMRRQLQSLHAALADKPVPLVQSVPADDTDLTGDLRAAVERILQNPEPLAPAVKGKR